MALISAHLNAGVILVVTPFSFNSCAEIRRKDRIRKTSCWDLNQKTVQLTVKTQLHFRLQIAPGLSIFLFNRVIGRILPHISLIIWRFCECQLRLPLVQSANVGESILFSGSDVMWDWVHIFDSHVLKNNWFLTSSQPVSESPSESHPFQTDGCWNQTESGIDRTAEMLLFELCETER